MEVSIENFKSGRRSLNCYTGINFSVLLAVTVDIVESEIVD